MITLAQLVGLDTNYLGKHNANYAIIEDAINALQSQVVSSLGPFLTGANGFEAAFGDVNTLINDASYVPQPSGTNLSVSAGYFWHKATATIRKSASVTVLAFAGDPAATYYLVIDSTGAPTKSATSTDAAYSVVWDGAAFGAITRLAPVAWGYKTFDAAKALGALQALYQNLDSLLEGLGKAQTALLAKTVTGSDVTLTTLEAMESIVIRTSGTMTAARNLIVPALAKPYFVINNCIGGFQLTVKTPSGTGIALLEGQKAVLYCDGTNVVEVLLGQVGGAPPSGTGDNKLISGGGVSWISGLSFRVAAAIYQIQGFTYSSPQTDVTLASADPTNPRIDIIAVNTSNAVIVIQGTPAAAPAAPDVDPNTELDLTFILVPAGATTPGVTQDAIYKENAEWTGSVSGGTMVLNSTNSPLLGTLCVEATSAATNHWFQFDAPASLDLATRNNLSFNIKNKAAWPTNRTITMRWRLSGVNQGVAVLLRNGVFGFSSSNITSYQQIVVPVSAFAVGGLQVNQIRFTVTGTGGNLGFHLDEAYLQGGIGPGAAASMVHTGVWDAAVAYAPQDFVIRSGIAFVSIQAGTNQDPLTKPLYWTPVVLNQPYDLAGMFNGKPTASMILGHHLLAREVTFPASLTGSRGQSRVAATAQTDFDIQKNGTSVGTMRWAAAATNATFIMASQQIFAAGEVLKVVSPATPDAALEDITFTLTGTRKAF
ncbi:MAG: hypothetical protein ACREK4_00125 [Candidatus Rokuibacteriota bacterium]